ncbi:MAG TPA: glycoside hydrolase 43 family protein [Polyangia bacterium]|nr:glycoside hydrolase 43 family protein [Polyangia bacterium]
MTGHTRRIEAASNWLAVVSAVCLSGCGGAKSNTGTSGFDASTPGSDGQLNSGGAGASGGASAGTAGSNASSANGGTSGSNVSSATGGASGGSVSSANGGALGGSASSANGGASGSNASSANGGVSGGSVSSAAGGIRNGGTTSSGGVAGTAVSGGRSGGTTSASGGVGGSTSVSPVLVPGAWGDQGDGTFKNPVLWSDYNNLDVITVGADFYMIAASHHFMGMPVLHSKDGVNWTLIARIYRRLDLNPRYDTPGQAYQNGTWAPAIRYHEGRFWVYVTSPTDGLIMTSTADAAGPWDPWFVVKAIAGWEDPCPFWDDVKSAGGDGPNGEKAYLIRSQTGAGPLIVQQMSWDGKQLLGTTTTVANGPTLEGPKLGKRNGTYYIFAPEGGIDSGYQVVLRSSAILGPYTKKTILERGSTSTNGPHQGSWIDLPSGQSWFYHFQQNGGWGRIGHLEPAQWGTDDWPKAGVDLDGNGIGEPVAQPKKPDVGGTFPITVPASSDEFDGSDLGVQWLWNHNPDDTKWSLSARPGWLRLSARPLANKSGTSAASGSVPFVEDSIIFAYNTVVQLAMGKVASAVTKLDTTGMVDGQRAGITLFGQTYGWIGVVNAAGKGTVRANVDDTYSTGPTLTSTTVYLKASMSASSQISFAYSTDGVTFTPLGGSATVGRTWFEGIKFGLFTYNLSTATAGGVADFDYFHYTHDGPHPAP